MKSYSKYYDLKQIKQWDTVHCFSPSTQWEPDVPSSTYFTSQKSCGS